LHVTGTKSAVLSIGQMLGFMRGHNRTDDDDDDDDNVLASAAAAAEPQVAATATSTMTTTAAEHQLDDEFLHAAASVHSLSTEPAPPALQKHAFKVSAALAPRLARMRVALQARYPESKRLFTDAYLASVMTMPSSKNAKVMRTFKYARDKLLKSLQWRRDQHVDAVFKHPERLRATLQCGSLYFCGYDVKRRPILWVRPKLKNWKQLDVAKETAMHILLIETCLHQLMPTGVTQFCLVADARGVGFGQMNVKMMKSLLKVLTTGYPDRLGALAAGPINFFLRGVYRMLSPFIPRNLSKKIKLIGTPNKHLAYLLGDDTTRLPRFFGGATDHAFVDYHDMVVRQLKQLDALEHPADGAATTAAASSFSSSSSSSSAESKQA
jgi:hypothetical protein